MSNYSLNQCNVIRLRGLIPSIKPMLLLEKANKHQRTMHLKRILRKNKPQK